MTLHNKYCNLEFGESDHSSTQLSTMKVSSSPKEKRRSRSKSRSRKFPVNEPRNLGDTSDRASNPRSSSRSRALTRALDDDAKNSRKTRSSSLDSRAAIPSTKIASRIRELSPLEGGSSHGKSRRSRSGTRIPISSGSHEPATSPMTSEDTRSRRRRGTSTSRLPNSSPSGKSPVERHVRSSRGLGRRQDMAQQRKNSKLSLELAVDHLEQKADQEDVEEIIEKLEKRDLALEKVKALAKSHASNQRAATLMASTDFQQKYQHINIGSASELVSLSATKNPGARTSASLSRFEDSFDMLNASSEEVFATTKTTKTPCKITKLSLEDDPNDTTSSRRLRVNRKNDTITSPISTTIRSSSSSRLDDLQSSDNNKERLRSRRNNRQPQPRLPGAAPRTGSAPSLSALVADAAALNSVHTKKGTANAAFRRTASREIPRMNAAARAKRLQEIMG
jgi:hypothetical protein